MLLRSRCDENLLHVEKRQYHGVFFQVKEGRSVRLTSGYIGVSARVCSYDDLWVRLDFSSEAR